MYLFIIKPVAVVIITAAAVVIFISLLVINRMFLKAVGNPAAATYDHLFNYNFYSDII